MKSLNAVIFYALLSFAAAGASAAAMDPVVGVTGGQIKGRVIPSGGAVFKGVPFAQPAVGELRWRDPVPVKPWTGVRDTGAYGPACTQRNSGRRADLEGNQEDCLYLNVWTPDWPAKTPKPVMLWLFGGSNNTGAGSEPYLDGTSLSRRGVVMVTINFRLGVFGFFAHPGLTVESPHHSSGNYGLLDQVAALKWVRDNIAKFGGDPRNVTLFGQSSGGMDTAFLVASPLAKGLIHRAIQESGPPIRQYNTLADAEQLGVKLAASMKAPAQDAEAVKYLRALPGPELQKASLALKTNLGDVAVTEIDGYVILKNVALVFEEGHEQPVPIIVGNNAREQSHDYSPEVTKRWIKGNFGSLAPKAEEFYGYANGGTGNDDPFHGSPGAQITADTRQRCPAIAEGIWRSAHGRTTYEYLFDPPVAGEAFTKHTAEIPFVFGNLLPKGFAMGGPYTDADKKISADIQQYWINFAKTGNPNGNGLPEWPKFNATARPYLEFTLHDGPQVKEGLRRNICDLYIEALKETIPAGTVAAYPE